MGARTRLHTNWTCACGSKLQYRSRFITKSGTLTRYYVCSSDKCNRVYKGEETLTFYKDRSV